MAVWSSAAATATGALGAATRPSTLRLPVGRHRTHLARTRTAPTRCSTPPPPLLAVVVVLALPITTLPSTTPTPTLHIGATQPQAPPCAITYAHWHNRGWQQPRRARGAMYRLLSPLPLRWRTIHPCWACQQRGACRAVVGRRIVHASAPRAAAVRLTGVACRSIGRWTTWPSLHRVGRCSSSPLATHLHSHHLRTVMAPRPWRCSPASSLL